MPPDVPGSGERLRATVARHPLAVDVLVAVGLTALSIVTIAGGALDFGRIEPVTIALILLQTLPLAVRRVAPVPVFLVTFGALLGQGLFAGTSFNSSLGALVALFTVAERLPERISLGAALLAAAAITLLIVSRAGLPAGLSGLVQSILTVFVVWLVGCWAQERRRYIGTVEERAARAERERERREVLAVAVERERIARELHDVVSHHVSVIVIQAGAAARALDRRPADARAAVDAIDHSARAAMTEMRRMLGILGPGGGRGDAGAEVRGTSGGPGDEALAPMPRLDRLGALLEQIRAAGQRVELTLTGDPRPLDPGLELTAFRTIQEALTNTLKHAPGGRVTVTVGYDPEALTLEIVDDGGRGRDGSHERDEPGRGLIGMIERAALFGGTLEAGRHGPGFRVAARLPLPAPDATATAASGAAAVAH